MTIRSHTSTTYITGKTRTVWGTDYPYQRAYNTSETYVGGDNPGWLKAVKAGQNATNPLEASKSFCEIHPIDMQATVWYWPHTQVGTTAHGVIGYPQGYEPDMPDASHSSSALADCVARFNGKLQDEMRPVQGLVFLGEIRETIGMIKQSGKRLLTHIESYVKRARRLLRSDYKSRKVLKKLSDLWLENAFGWTPLYLDIAAGVKSLTVPRSERTFIRAWSEKRDVRSQMALGPITIGSLNVLACDWLIRSTNVSSAQQVAALDMSLVGQPAPEVADSFQKIAERWGLTARGFIPAAWELIPSSFLVDYYLNIGAVIDAAFADRRAIAWGYQTQRTTAVNEMRWQNCRPTPNAYYAVITSNRPGSVKVGTKRFSRKSSLTAIPPITIGYPDFGGLQYANQIALILGRLRTR